MNECCTKIDIFFNHQYKFNKNDNKKKIYHRFQKESSRIHPQRSGSNLAIQAIGKNLNKKNFLPTLAFGALGGIISDYVDSKVPNSYGLASGALSGLTLGLTNSLIN